MSEMKEQGKIYSYHNFIYPFIWEDSARKVNKKEIIESYFENNEYWENINRDNEVFSKSDWIKLYSKNEYFHAAFKEAILGYNDKYKCDKSIVAQYEFNKKYISKGAEYIITKSVSENNEFKKKEYILDVKSISIKIFNTGIAVLILECINYHESNLNDIKKINDYGRRVSLPFIPDEYKYSICADELTLRIHGIDENKYLLNVKESFKDSINQILNQSNFSMKNLSEQSNRVCRWIIELLELGNKGEFLFRCDGKQTNEINIHSALDERMYVMCMINSDKCKKIAEENLRNQTDSWWLDWIDKEKQEFLYELAFVDAGSCSCQSNLMRKELLKNCVYDRWINYGTVYSVTPQAFICMSSDELIITSFCNMYLDMCVLSLVQRASLINFQDIALDLSKGLEKIGTVIDTRKIKKLMDLQERFIAFQNQINLQEISSQEQAIELYERFRKVNFVDDLMGALKEQLDALYDATNTNQDYSFNKWALLFTIIALGIDVPTYLFRTDGKLFFMASKWNAFCVFKEIVPHLTIFIITLCAIIYVFHKFNRKNKK